MADEALINAILECENFVKSWENDLLDLAAILKNKLTIILHEIANEATVYTVFEVLNSRGLDVASLDRLKSLLMAIHKVVVKSVGIKPMVHLGWVISYFFRLA